MAYSGNNAIIPNFQQPNGPWIVDEPSFSQSDGTMEGVFVGPSDFGQRSVAPLFADTICSGWVKLHTFRECPQPFFTFWRLSRRAISMYHTEDVNTSPSPFEEILMSRIIGIEEEENVSESWHVFVIRVTGVVYYVGDRTTEQDLQSSQQWMAQIRYWCLQSLTPDATFDIFALYDVDVNRIVGFGQFGVVYSAVVRTTGEKVAIKAIDPYLSKTRNVMTETRVLLDLKHPGVIRIFAVHWALTKIYIVSELLHGDMSSLIMSQSERRLSERLTKFFAYQLICAVTYLEAKRVAHCDLKPANVLLVNNHPFPQIKLCDFGYSVILSDGSMRKGGSFRTGQYMPLEIVSCKPGEKPTFDLTIDTWSTGVIIFLCLTGAFPYNIEGDVKRQVTDEAFLFSPQRWRSETSNAAKMLIKQMLSLETSQRRWVMKRAKLHPWFTDEEASATYQFWCDMMAFEARLTSEGRLTKSYWLDELGVNDNKLAQLGAKFNALPWQEIGCLGPTN